MKKFGLIGYPLSHSFSQIFFTEKFSKEGINDCEYNLYPIEQIAQIKEILSTEKNHLRGLNVTIPHKISVIDWIDELSDEAEKIGAVNCIKIKPDQSTKGYNTDVYGFRESLIPLLEPQHQKALVLGNGGACKAVIYALKQLDIHYQLVSRKASTHAISYNDVDASVIQEHKIIINTTPLGMSPAINTAPEIPYEYVGAQHLAYDLVYNPEETLFLKRCRDKGAKTINGLKMLHLQAIKAWEIWNT